jgi:excisionase family DNA binding protein
MNLMTIEEVANELGISRQRVYEYCRAGRLGSRWGGRWLITKEQFEEFRRTYTDKPGRPPKK